MSGTDVKLRAEIKAFPCPIQGADAVASASFFVTEDRLQWLQMK